MKNISATRYTTFSHCPLKYKYQYHYKLLQEKSDALEIGTVYHEVLEEYHKSDESSARKIIAGNKKHSDMLNHLFSKYLDNPVLGNVVETECRFYVDVPGVDIPLYGFIDRVDEDKGVEYKTTSKKWNEEDVDTIQTDIYLYALMKKFGRPMPLVYSINNKKTKVLPQIIEVKKSEEEILGVEKKIIDFINSLKVTKFEANVGSHCFFCPWGSKGDKTCPAV